MLYTGSMGASQRKGIITLIPKSNDTLDINNYRPISLLCVDYKILAKILSERMKCVLHKVINSKQFCGVPGRSINQCNMELRDLIYYSNDSNLDLALLNLDWYKAFDLVPVDFVFNNLQTLGFFPMPSEYEFIHTIPGTILQSNGGIFSTTHTTRLN